MSTISTYTTTVHGFVVTETTSLEDAIKAWDACESHREGDTISVETRDGDVIVRQGNLIHVESDRVYVNTGLIDGRA